MKLDKNSFFPSSRKHGFLCLLAALLLVSTVTSCGGDTSETTTNTDNSQTDTTPTETETTLYAADYLPDVTYDGYEYRIYDYEEWPAHIDEPSGNIIDDAIYKRNMIVEEKYDIKFVTNTRPFTQYAEVSTIIYNAAMAQSDDLDLGSIPMMMAYNHVLTGVIPAGSQLPVADMTQPWHNQILAESLTIDGITLLDFTSLEISPGGSCMIFNKKIVEDLGMDNPYDLVDEGKWVSDTFYSMAEQAIMDLDGDGQMTVSDRYGIIGEWDRFVEVAYRGTGLKMVEIEDGIPTVSMSEALIDVFTRFVQYRDITGSVFDTFAQFGTAESSRDEGWKMFKAGQSLFIAGGTGSLTTLGDMEDDYGVVPYPKWSEEQDTYYCTAGDLIYVPLSCSTDLERVCTIKEALAVETLNYYYPAYYEDAIQNRYVRDTDSVRMMEIITNGIYIDLGTTIWWNIIRTPWMSCISSNNTNFASEVAKNKTLGDKAIKELLEAVEFIKGQE